MSNMNSSLIFNDYVVNHVLFETNDEFEEGQIDVQFDVDRKVDYDDKNENIAYVTLARIIHKTFLWINYKAN